MLHRLGTLAAVGLLAIGVTLGSTTGEARATPHPNGTGEGGGSAQQVPCNGEIENKRAHLAETIRFWYMGSDVRVAMRVWMNVRYHWCHDKPYRGNAYEVTGCYDLAGTKGLGPDSIFFRGVDLDPYISEIHGGALVNPAKFRIDKRRDHNCETHTIDPSKRAWMWIKNPENRNQYNTRIKAHVQVVITASQDPEGRLGPKAMRPSYDDTV